MNEKENETPIRCQEKNKTCVLIRHRRRGSIEIKNKIKVCFKIGLHQINLLNTVTKAIYYLAPPSLSFSLFLLLPLKSDLVTNTNPPSPFMTYTHRHTHTRTLLPIAGTCVCLWAGKSVPADLWSLHLSDFPALGLALGLGLLWYSLPLQPVYIGPLTQKVLHEAPLKPHGWLSHLHPPA